MALNETDRVAVTSRSFSQNAILRAELLQRYAHVTFNDAGAVLAGETLVAFLQGHDKAITALETISADVLSQLPDLKVLSKYGVGLDMIDLPALQRYGKRLGWKAGVNRRAVAELALALALTMVRRIHVAHADVMAGGWRQIQGGQLSGRTVGIVGCGHIGKELVQLLAPFGCRILVHDIVSYPEFFAAHQVTPVPLAELLAQSAVVSLHVPLDATTRGLLHADALASMQPDAVLINTARGGLVDEDALFALLRDGRLGAAAFDVFDAEPPQCRPLLELPNFFATPHIGGSSREAVLAMGRSAIEQLEV